MLNVGPLELVVVLAVALIVVGPERLPELARSVGRVIRQFRDVQNEVRDLVSSEVDDDVRQAADDFRAATGGLTRATDVKGAVRRAERTIRDETAKFRASRPASTSKRSGVSGGAEPAEAAGPPADRLVEDGAATPPAPRGDRPEREGPTDTDPTGPETSGDR